MGVMEGIKWERNEQHSDRSENHDRRLYLRRFEVEKVKFLVSYAVCLYLELRLQPGQGAHFQKNHEKKRGGKWKMEPGDLRWQE